MKKIIILALAIMAFASVASADQYVRGHYNHNGTYVEGYHRSDPDGDRNNNYSHKGNVNPWTGQRGSKN